MWKYLPVPGCIGFSRAEEGKSKIRILVLNWSHIFGMLLK